MAADVIQGNVGRFMRLFSGLDIAFGTGRGQWVKRPPTLQDFDNHLHGRGPGIGIAPLRPDNTVLFAAIDLDEPDFDAAREMQKYLPGCTFVERSRSGNAHVWCFFAAPCPAWLPMGVMKVATEAAGKPHVEVFPKNHDFTRVKLGNYINLPFHGFDRPILRPKQVPFTLDEFLMEAEFTKQDPEDWRKKADWLLISPPEKRTTQVEFGTQSTLHECAQHVLSGAAGPVTAGHRSVVYFSLAKQILNCSQYDVDECVELLRALNAESAPDTIPDSELLRIIGNAERGQFTSTGCDDPLFTPYAHPDCRIANPRR